MDNNSRILIQGITGREASATTGYAIAYGTQISAGVTPGKGGQKVAGVPVYDTVKQACRDHDLNVSVLYVPPAVAYDAALEAIANGIELIVIITERIPLLCGVNRVLCTRKMRQNSSKLVGIQSRLSCM